MDCFSVFSDMVVLAALFSAMLTPVRLFCRRSNQCFAYDGVFFTVCMLQFLNPLQGGEICDVSLVLPGGFQELFQRLYA